MTEGDEDAAKHLDFPAVLCEHKPRSNLLQERTSMATKKKAAVEKSGKNALKGGSGNPPSESTLKGGGGPAKGGGMKNKK